MNGKTEKEERDERNNEAHEAFTQTPAIEQGMFVREIEALPADQGRVYQVMELVPGDKAVVVDATLDERPAYPATKLLPVANLRPLDVYSAQRYHVGRGRS